MIKRALLFCLFLFVAPFFLSAQYFDQLKSLAKERDALKASYDKLNDQARTAKRSKPTAELQAAFEKLMAKDAELVQEISHTESVLNKDLELASKPKNEKTRPSIIRKNDPAQLQLIDSLSEALTVLQFKHDSVLKGSASDNSYVQTLQNELRKTADDKAIVQGELDQIKTDKFILARRNMILLYFNVGVAILLFSALIYTVFSLRKRKKGFPALADSGSLKPRPVTGFGSPLPKIAMDAYDSKLEKIEMLGKLRERGLLTDDEFNMQKQQLLQNKNNV